MQAPEQIEAEASRFFDGGTDDEPPRTLPEVAYELTRVVITAGNEPSRELFRLRRRIGYDDRHHGEILVPGDCSTFLSDLTSVPALFTWLVPKSGDHLPAALIHDGLVREPGQPPEHIGAAISRVEADRVFRDAMADSGTGVIRRWIVWAAVTLATIWARQGTAASERGRSYLQWVMAGTLASIAWLGYQATADLANRSGRWPCTYELFWIVGDSGWSELASGAAGAIVVPLLISPLWGRFWRAGAIAGMLLGALFHVTLALLMLSAIYTVAEAGASSGTDGLRHLVRTVTARWRAGVTALAAVVILVAFCAAL